MPNPTLAVDKNKFILWSCYTYDSKILPLRYAVLPYKNYFRYQAVLQWFYSSLQSILGWELNAYLLVALLYDPWFDHRKYRKKKKHKSQNAHDGTCLIIQKFLWYKALQYATVGLKSTTIKEILL
jgi:hypothetical protein